MCTASTVFSSETERGEDLHSRLREAFDEEHDELDKQSDATHAYEWTVQIERGNDEDAKNLADSYGFDVVSKIDVGDGVFRVLNSKEEKREKVNDTYASKREILLGELAQRLKSDKRIMWYKR